MNKTNERIAHASALFLSLFGRTLSENVRSSAEREAVVSDLSGLLNREDRRELRVMAGLPE